MLYRVAYRRTDVTSGPADFQQIWGFSKFPADLMLYIWCLLRGLERISPKNQTPENRSKVEFLNEKASSSTEKWGPQQKQEADKTPTPPCFFPCGFSEHALLFPIRNCFVVWVSWKRKARFLGVKGQSLRNSTFERFQGSDFWVKTALSREGSQTQE